MFPAFFEAIRATTQPCTLLLLLPPLVMSVVMRGRWAPFAAICVGAVLGGWLFAANVIGLSDAQLQLSGLLVAASFRAVIAAPNVAWPRKADTPIAQTIAAGTVTFIATLWWRPCIGRELGTILTASRRGVTAQLPGIATYMLGAMVPVLAAILILKALDPSPGATRRAASGASLIGLAVATAMALGHHDEFVTTLTRWTRA